VAPSSRLDHVAHAAHRIRDLLPLYQGVLGGRFYGGGDNSRVGYRAVVLTFPQGGKVELMEPAGDAGFLDSFLRRNPLGGLHHTTYYVDDIDMAIASAEAAGFSIVGTWFERPDYKEAFLHPRSSHGVLVQFVQVSSDYRLQGVGSDLETVLSGPS
jgi:methylmalonyl-CoA/ethylmalonyl-CoA epimerase